MSGEFEIDRIDAAGRLGSLSLPTVESTIRTPALLPVINPNKRTLSASALVDEFDPQALITNAYVIYQDDTLRERALDAGVHGLLDVSCPIMTDSGSFQLAEYGDIDVDNHTIVTFQCDIGSNIVTPIDIPTPPDESASTTEADLEVTHERIDEARSLVGSDRLLSAPVQGSTHPDLRRQAGRQTRALAGDIYPIGAVVPLMESYRLADLVDVVVAAKRGLGPDAPVHLFGAGHPMMFSLAVALGCDLFDSAAYALFARDDRYLTPAGTEHLDELSNLPCPCPVCVAESPDSLRDADDARRERLLARHNLHVSFAEMRRIRQAIASGTLFELLERRARAHPAMLTGYRRLLDHDDYLERRDPSVKGAFMYLSTESALRPEVGRHHRRLRSMNPSGTIGLAMDDTEIDATVDERWSFVPPFGPVPPGIEHTYPVSGEMPDRLDRAAIRAGVEGIAALLDGANDLNIILRLPSEVDPPRSLPANVRLLDDT